MTFEPESTRCGCGKTKPKGTDCCWRCIERDKQFQVLDALIASDLGSVKPEDVMRKGIRTGDFTLKAPRPEIASPDPDELTEVLHQLARQGSPSELISADLLN